MQLTKSEAHVRFSPRVGKCSKCSKLYVWSRSASIELNREEAPCCAGSVLALSTWGKRTATLLVGGNGEVRVGK